MAYSSFPNGAVSTDAPVRLAAAKEAMMSAISLPTKIQIRHRFFTATSNLTFSDDKGNDLFESSCPSLRLRKKAIIYTLDKQREELLTLAPVWGLSNDVMLSLPNEEVLGVLQKVDEPQDIVWLLVDAAGRRRLSVRQEGSALDRIKQEVTLFSTRVKKLFVGEKYIGSFYIHSGYVHERYTLELDPQALETVDARFLLATTVVLTGIFSRVFT